MNNQLQLAFEQLQDAWAALVDTFTEIWEKIKDVVSDAWNALFFWRRIEKNSAGQSRIELFDSTELF